MAGGVNKNMSLASANSNLPSGIFSKVILVFFVGILAWAYQEIRPPPNKVPGSPDGPPITGPRIKLRDGRHLAYKERGVSKDVAKYKIIYLHPFGSCRHDPLVSNSLSQKLIEELGIYIVNFDRPGHGERVSLLTPAINYWWPSFPANLSTEAYNQLMARDQWAIRVFHYTPWLSYWWNSQKWFPGYSVIANTPVLSKQDREIAPHIDFASLRQARQQGEAESVHRDAVIGFGKWEFDPMDLENPFPDGSEGSVHLWQGDEDGSVPVTLQRYIAQRLPWIRYHELPGSGHMFPFLDGLFDKIVRIMLTGDQNY